jgi:hypothetical protein
MIARWPASESSGDGWRQSPCRVIHHDRLPPSSCRRANATIGLASARVLKACLASVAGCPSSAGRLDAGDLGATASEQGRTRAVARRIRRQEQCGSGHLVRLGQATHTAEDTHHVGGHALFEAVR